MPDSSNKSESIEFKAWRSPHLLTHLFQLFDKLIKSLNDSVPPENIDVNAKPFKAIEFNKINDGFSRQMMPCWLSLAKSYYPFYNKNEEDMRLIGLLEQTINIKTTDYESLPLLIEKEFLANHPRVNTNYQKNINYIEKAMARVISVALSTPALINTAHQHNKKQFEEAGPSMSSCIGPIEVILKNMMNQKILDKSFTIAASFLLLHIKAIKSNFEQLSLIQQLESTQKENEKLKREKDKLGMEVEFLATLSLITGKQQKKLLQLSESKKETLALFKIFKLQKRINQYFAHLTEVVASSPNDEKAVAKLKIVAQMKNDLDEDHALPSRQIEALKQQLEQTKEKLEEHRDPMWKRFLRDCLRILAFTFSGVAIYRTITGEPVNFFKPSHGQKFVESVNHITNP